MSESILRDAEMRLPRKLVGDAMRELLNDGEVSTYTAALLIEAGADMHRIEKQLEEQYRLLLAEGR